jgi:hypothetical protein
MFHFVRHLDDQRRYCTITLHKEYIQAGTHNGWMLRLGDANDERSTGQRRASIQWSSSVPCYLIANHRVGPAKSGHENGTRIPCGCRAGR